MNEVLSLDPQRIVTVWLQQSLRNSELSDRLSQAGISIQWSSKDKLLELAGSQNHQGVVAEVIHKSPNFSAFLERMKQLEEGIVVVLEGIHDPQNAGSIIRAAEFFGASAVVHSTNRGSPITPAVSKASAGASEIIELLGVPNVAQAIEKLKEVGFWIVVTAVDEKAESVYDLSLPKKVILVLGSEGKGVQDLVQRRADFRVFVPRVGTMDSLNVGQAAAVCLSEFRRKLATGHQ